MRIYTKTGDTGDTGLFDGTRVSKHDPRVDAYGEVDELSAWIGLVRAERLPADIDDRLGAIQRDLFALGSMLADPTHRIAKRVDKATLTPASVKSLEGAIDAFETELPPLKRFIFAGGTPAAAKLHLARAVCRRAERATVGLGADAVDAIVIQYVNRLSDLLFVMARVLNHRAGVTEVEW
jgi:cob(I)alamin adenosyltransferase